VKLPIKSLLCAAVTAMVAFGVSGSGEASPTAGMVRINGVATPVYFNDGDTFRALAGQYRRRPARLAGFNTLESYGPVHRWGGWSYRELYVNAKQATLNARRGVWNCDLDPTQKDGYGRVLAVCLDLAEDQIRKGLAHAYSIGNPSPMRLIKAQREAIVQGRGMWAKGVPAMVLTSLHSADERLNNENNYNRLISSLDGLSAKWKHQDLYGECEEVCHPTVVLDDKTAMQVIAELRADESTRKHVAGMEDVYLMALLNEYTTTGRVAQVFDGKNGHAVVAKLLDAMKAQGVMSSARKQDGSCVVYATFERRYRVKPKPGCLKW
jgi:endonuclease YncB( thermonuclease family)